MAINAVDRKNNESQKQQRNAQLLAFGEHLLLSESIFCSCALSAQPVTGTARRRSWMSTQGLITTQAEFGRKRQWRMWEREKNIRVSPLPNSHKGNRETAPLYLYFRLSVWAFGSGFIKLETFKRRDVRCQSVPIQNFQWMGSMAAYWNGALAPRTGSLLPQQLLLSPRAGSSSA